MYNTKKIIKIKKRIGIKIAFLFMAIIMLACTGCDSKNEDTVNNFDNSGGAVTSDEIISNVENEVENDQNQQTNQNQHEEKTLAKNNIKYKDLSNEEIENLLKMIHEFDDKFSDSILEEVASTHNLTYIITSKNESSSHSGYDLWRFNGAAELELISEDLLDAKVFKANDFVYIAVQGLEFSYLDYVIYSSDMKDNNLNLICTYPICKIYLTDNTQKLVIVNENNLKIVNHAEVEFDESFYPSKDNKKSKLFDIREYSPKFYQNVNENKCFFAYYTDETKYFHIFDTDTYDLKTIYYSDLIYHNCRFAFNPENGYILYDDYEEDIDYSDDPDVFRTIYVRNLYTGDVFEICKTNESISNYRIYFDENNKDNVCVYKNDTSKETIYSLLDKNSKKKYVKTMELNTSRVNLHLKKIDKTNGFFNTEIISCAVKSLDNQFLIDNIEKYTGWKLDIKSILVEDNKKITVCFGKDSTLFTNKFREKIDGYYSDNRVLLSDIILDTISDTLKANLITDDIYQKAEVYFCMNDSRTPVTIDDINVKIPVDKAYNGLYAFEYSEQKKSDSAVLAESAVKNKLSSLTDAQININQSFKVGEAYYVVSSIHGKMLGYEEKYNDIELYPYGSDNIKLSEADSYELWKYENNECKRLIYSTITMKVKNCCNYPDGSYIYVDSGYLDQYQYSANYIIKYTKSSDDSMNMVYELKCSDFVVSPDKKCVAVIIREESIAILKDDKVIFNSDTGEYWDNGLICLEDFWWSSDSQQFNYILYGLNRYINTIDITDGKIIDNVCFEASMDRYIVDKDNCYIVYSTYKETCGGIDEYAECMNKKIPVELKLLNLKTGENFTLHRNYEPYYKVEKISDTLISYDVPNSSDGERETIDISKYIQSNRKQVQKSLKNYIISDKVSSDTITDKDINIISCDKVGDNYYQFAEILKDESKYYDLYINNGNEYTRLVENIKNAKVFGVGSNYYIYYEKDNIGKLCVYSYSNCTTLYDGKIEMLESFENCPYIISCGINGDLMLINDKNLELCQNIYDDLIEVTNDATLSSNHYYWSEDYKKLVILIKNENENKLAAIKSIDIEHKEIKRLVSEPEGDYDHIYVECSNVFALYTEKNGDKISFVAHNLLNDKKVVIVEDAEKDYYGYCSYYQGKYWITYFMDSNYIENDAYELKNEFFN